MHLLNDCDYCKEQYYASVNLPWGNNFCAVQCNMLFEEQVRKINRHIQELFMRTYESKPANYKFITPENKYVQNSKNYLFPFLKGKGYEE